MRFTATIVALTCFAAPASSLAQTSTFDANLEGWSGTAPGLAWTGADGNPPGALSFSDATSDGSFAIAPPVFLGDWTDLEGDGQLSYEYKINSVGEDISAFRPYEVRISGPGGEAAWIGLTPSGTTGWVQNVAPIVENSWTVTAGTWSSLISNVTSLQVRVEHVSNAGPVGDSGAMDNVSLAATPPAVPILSPLGIGVLSASLLGVGAWRAGRPTRRCS